MKFSDSNIESIAPAPSRRRATQMLDCILASLLFTPLQAVLADNVSVPDSEPKVLVRRIVPANFHDETVNITAFSATLDNSLQRLVAVRPGDTLSGILKKEFKISKSWTPAVYDQLEEHVREKNGIKNLTTDVRAGSALRLPDLPVTSQTSHGMVVPTQAKTSYSGLWNKDLRAFIAPANVAKGVSSTAKLELQIRSVSLSELSAMKFDWKASRQEQERSGQYQQMQGEMPVTFATVLSDGQAVGLNPTESAFLSKFMARQATTKPYVVILDDGWPSQDDFFHAARFISSASRVIREAFSLKNAANGDSEDLKSLDTAFQIGTTFCDANCEYPTLKSHSAMIRKSLEDLTDIDKKKNVEVIYLPLNKASRFSTEILSELFRVTLLAESVTNQLVYKKNDTTFPVNTMPGTPDYAGVETQVRALISPAYLSRAPLPDASGTITVNTDKSIIDAVVNFLWLYSMASQRPHFLSMSWTAPNLRLPAFFRPNGYGLWFAAAGNDPNINVHALEVQYAARSSDPGDVVAVENTASSGCATSTLSANPNLPVLGFAFPGRIDAYHCGTSFSTPRVAWLLAAKEAIKGDVVMPGANEAWTQWRSLKKAALISMNDIRADGEQRYRTSIWRLLDEQVPN